MEHQNGDPNQKWRNCAFYMIWFFIIMLSLSLLYGLINYWHP